MKTTPADAWIINPIQRFIQSSTTSGIVLFSSAFLAIIIANSPWSEAYHMLWKLEFSVGFAGHYITKNLQHWINDGLMAVFFFVIGLELKRHVIAGDLRDPGKAILPIAAAIGGMVFPAAIYLLFNSSGDVSDGWGIPMATDIAFALGILYLLGNKVPLSLKIFLTVLAVVDDIGAVLVIAFFYTSEISFISLATGGVFMLILIVSNIIGIRNTGYYAIIGIGGLWLAFLMSGVHATIAAVLAAMTIPADVKVTKDVYTDKLTDLIGRLRKEIPNSYSTVTNEQFRIIDDVRKYSKEALTPLQRLERALYPFVAYVVMPVFAFANAGITLSEDFFASFQGTVFPGVFFGLLVGKFLGVFGIAYLLLRLNLVRLPSEMNLLHLLGAAFLASIGFTMSLFITGLAFTDVTHILEAKTGILFVSVIAALIGYFIIRYANNRNTGLQPRDRPVAAGSE